MIYFAACGSFVKIGYTDHTLWARLDQIQVGVPEYIELLGIIEGSRADEVALHDKLSANRYRGEWFHRTAEVLDVIHEAPQLDVPPPIIRGGDRAIFRTKDGWFVASRSRASGPYPTRQRAHKARERRKGLNR